MRLQPEWFDFLVGEVQEYVARVACVVRGHRWVFSHRGAPVVPPILVCSRCGKYERA